MVAQLIFLLLLISAIVVFAINVSKIRANIAMGRPEDRSDRPQQRWATLMMVALGQSKLLKRPIAGFLHLLVYVGFVLINIEILEIFVDGMFGTHRVFAPFLGGFYGLLIGFFEILALGVWVSCVILLFRRDVLRITRFQARELTLWPQRDAHIILVAEIVLMTAFLTLDAADFKLQQLGASPAIGAGAFPVSTWLTRFLPNDVHGLEMVERISWWAHIVGIFIFLNYLPYSKHFHIILAFPNTYFSNLNKKGRFQNLDRVKEEVQAMLDPSYVSVNESTHNTEKFGARDVNDLSWKNLMDAYSCTQCGRCTSECPANITGKLLSPRKIMMDTKNRLTEVGAQRRKHGAEFDDQKTLLNDYILPEELWACTTCNACTEACPINIDPLSIIVQLRQYLIMEESKAPASLQSMFNKIENNGAPWQFSPSDRFNWSQNPTD